MFIIVITIIVVSKPTLVAALTSHPSHMLDREDERGRMEKKKGRVGRFEASRSCRAAVP